MVQDRSEQVWRFYRYSLVYEYYDRPMLVPPLIVISHIYRTLLWCTRKTCSTKKYHNEFSKYSHFITLYLGFIGMESVISKSCYKGTSLQRNYRKMIM